MAKRPKSSKSLRSSQRATSRRSASPTKGISPLPDGTVVIAKKEPRADDGDSVIGKCLAFLARDMAIDSARFRPVPRSLVLRGEALVKGIRIDLDVPLPDDEA